MRHLLLAGRISDMCNRATDGGFAAKTPLQSGAATTIATWERLSAVGSLQLSGMRPAANQTKVLACRSAIVNKYVNHFMKALTLIVISLLTSSFVMADIQAPPGSDFGPTRKLGRGVSNILFGPTELFDSMAAVNYSEGNSAAYGYGLVRGIGRSFARLGYGIYEVALFPFPTQKGTYKPPYKSDIPWINSGYSEFPPELGWESRYNYARDSQRSPW